MQNTSIRKNKRTLIVSFLASVAPSVVKLFIPIEPCALCLVQRSGFVLVFIYTILSAKYKWFRILAKLVSLSIALIGLYHLAIVANFISGPKFCSLNQTLFQKTLSACQDAQPIFIIASITASIICLKQK